MTSSNGTDVTLRANPPRDTSRKPNLLIGYDGSPDAQHALRLASALFPNARATVACVWQSDLTVELRHGGGYGLMFAEGEPELYKEESVALSTASAGRDLARTFGLDADATQRETGPGEPVWKTLEDLADELQPTLVVVGTRGLGGIRSTLLGSVSRHLVELARHPVLVIPQGRGHRQAPLQTTAETKAR